VVQQALGESASQPGDKLPALVVLISDGKRTVGRSQKAAAKAAKAQGVPIYTVALGTTAGVIVNQGQTILVPVEIGELRQIAQISGGKSYVATNPSELLSAYRDVHGVLTYQTERTDMTSRYVGWLVLLSMLSTAAGLFVASRWP
jgi:Ca-activated chloride channel homolog